MNKIEKRGHLKIKVLYYVQTIHKFYYTLKNDNLELLAENCHYRKIIYLKKEIDNMTTLILKNKNAQIFF